MGRGMGAGSVSRLGSKSTRNTAFTPESPPRKSTINTWIVNNIFRTQQMALKGTTVNQTA